MRGKLIVIEGSDCSGKETQTQKLIERLTNEGYEVFGFSFPNYSSPTGQIVGGPYLGKPEICSSWFNEGAVNVDYLVASSLYAADRRYNIKQINDALEAGKTVILNRYVESNMAHQGGKVKSREERLKVFKKIDALEYDIMDLPRPDAVIFLYMPYDYACILKRSRAQKQGLDEHEMSEEHLKKAEEAYLELSEIYHFVQIDCVDEMGIRTIDDIASSVYEKVIKIIEK